VAVGQNPFPDMLPVAGIRLGTVEAGFRYKDRDDLLIIELAEGTRTAGVFTQNAFCAAPVTVAKQHLAEQAPAYLLINSGNANCGLGQQGLDVALQSCQMLAEATGAQAEQVLPFSTGVIAEPMDIACFQNALPAACDDLHSEHWEKAAKAIMTTDTFAKGASRQVTIGEQHITITGIAKGSGMIHPDMATMLAFVTTDANIAQDDLQDCLKQAADKSFNCITVDGDTSTNDACMLCASGQAGEPLTGVDLEQFNAAVIELMTDLALQIVRDGEGANRVMTVNVEAAVSEKEAKDVAFTVAHSPLVKTALFAADPNWGRILAAVGRAPLTDLVLEQIQICLNDVSIVKDGARDPHYTEEQGQQAMQQDEVIVHIALGRGEYSATVWSCDLSYDYVRINAEYRS